MDDTAPPGAERVEGGLLALGKTGQAVLLADAADAAAPPERQEDQCELGDAGRRQEPGQLVYLRIMYAIRSYYETVLTMVTPGSIAGVLTEGGRKPDPGKWTLIADRRGGSQGAIADSFSSYDGFPQSPIGPLLKKEYIFYPTLKRGASGSGT